MNTDELRLREQIAQQAEDLARIGTENVNLLADLEHWKRTAEHWHQEALELRRANNA